MAMKMVAPLGTIASGMGWDHRSGFGSIGRTGFESGGGSFGHGTISALPDFNDAGGNDGSAVLGMPEFEVHAAAHKSDLQHGTTP